MTSNTLFVHRLVIPLIFPAGLAPGAGKDGGNLLVLAKDGAGRPVLRGSAVAGILRHAWAERHGYDASPLGQDQALARWFGYALGDAEAPDRCHQNLPSPLRVADATLDTGIGAAECRNHNSIERHTGAVRDRGLFAIEALPPNTATNLVLYLHLDDESGATDFLGDILGLIQGGLIFGGHGARGVGMARLNGAASHRRFELAKLDDCAAWLDESWAWRSGAGKAFSSGDDLPASTIAQSLRVTLQLAVPRGQDICIGSGMGEDYQVEPQQVTAADGQRYWRLPGSSLRGHFRSWFNRLAARAALKGECHPPADSVERFNTAGREQATGDDLGWLYHDKEARSEHMKRLVEGVEDVDEVVLCPVAGLFGSLYSAGRIHIADAMSAQPINTSQRQHRKHVAVDRITGGASEGGLFDHAALLTGPRFTVEIVVRCPTEMEARWLAATIRALDVGLIRVGSSKSAGRLALAAVPQASGPHSECIETLKLNEVHHG